MTKPSPLTLAGLLLPALLLAACRSSLSEAQQCLQQPALAAAAAGSEPTWSGNVLVAYRQAPELIGQAAVPGLRQLQAAGLQARHGVALLEARNGVLPDVFRAEGDPQEVAQALSEDPRVAWAVADFSLQPLQATGCHDEQWNLSGFGVPEAWGTGPGPHGVTVAVIDSGIDVDHPELKDAMLPGFNFYDMNDDPRPVMATDNHGTHVAGIIAASGTEHVSGVAGFPDTVKVLPIRIFNDNALSASFDDLVLALAWAAGEPVTGAPLNEHPADLINLSLGAHLPPQAGVDAAISSVTGGGITVIAASGNDLSGTRNIGIYAPANSAAALAVGSVDSDAQLSWFSVYGGGDITVTAPGGSGPSSCGQVLSTVPGGYGCEAGTSMAAPFVTGSVALLLTHEPGLTPQQIEQRLQQAAWFDPGFMTGEAYGPGVLCTDRLLEGSPPAPGPC